MTTGRADVAGLGQVVEQYVLVEDDTKAGCVTYHGQVHWQVAGKGTIIFAVKTPDCLVPLNIVCDRTLDYVVTGGTGAFKHASGRGTLGYIGCQARSDTWTGSLSVLPASTG